jgi:hypothetical protein
MFWDIDIKGGAVIYDDISYLPDLFRSHEHIEFLKEDMLQIRYQNGVLIDVSWRPSFSPNGSFFIAAVKNSDWSNPIFQVKVKDVQGTKAAIRKMISDLT